MLTTLYRSAVAWTGIGLAGGLAYREITRSHAFTGTTQLALVHTHALALGTTIMLVLLALAAAFDLGQDRRFGWGVHTWNLGLALTTTMLAVKGTLQILNPAAADSAAFAGIAGLGHIALTAAFILLLLSVGTQVRARSAATGAALSAQPTGALA
ncbi:DUF2871 family protein [Gephyromycinifex aptenodytis]|uniref:DUF2871 family protein n=1 Tax=Gephyromycinifex aptenodytis TaxID=2716227 RepID=UPI001445074F|nr:DUF2871 family protein [Gephyromycinifex aptenodytis]